jgi:hypothetical protein
MLQNRGVQGLSAGLRESAIAIGLLTSRIVKCGAVALLITGAKNRTLNHDPFSLSVARTGYSETRLFARVPSDKSTFVNELWPATAAWRSCARSLSRGSATITP